MKQRTTQFLKLALFLIVIPFLSFFIILMPRIMSGLVKVIQVPTYLQYPGLSALYAAVIPFLFGLYQTIKLLINTSKDKAITESSIKILKNIKYSSITISALYVVGMPMLFLLADKDDAPGIILFALIIIMMTGAGAVFTTVLEKRYNISKSRM